MAAGIYKVREYAKIEMLTKEDWPGQAVLFLCIYICGKTGRHFYLEAEEQRERRRQVWNRYDI